MIAHGFFNVYSMCVDTLFLCFCEYHLALPPSSWVSSDTFELPLNVWLPLTLTNQALDLARLIKAALSVLSLSFLLPPRCSVRGRLCLLLLCWVQVKTWRGTTALPPGPTSCLPACTRSCAEGRRVLNYAAPPERCFDWTTDSFSHFSISAVNVGTWSGCLRASTAGLSIKTGCILFRPGREMTLHRKGIED